MSYKLLDYENFDSISLVLKPPFSIGSCYISEIWACIKTEDSASVVRPIFKTPRLRVKYGAKQFSQNANYGYCLNMSNKDIDPDINTFYKFIRTVDKALIGAFTESNKSWNVNPALCLKFKSALKRKSPTDDFHFQLKMVDIVNGDDRKIMTTIHNSDRSVAKLADITFGKYTDQFICPAFLSYDEQGIHPIWQAHQIVLSNIEKVFLEECLLDHIYPPFKSGFAEPVQDYIGQTSSRFHWFQDSQSSYDDYRPAAKGQTQLQPQESEVVKPMARFTINPKELFSVISSLKKQNREDDI